MGKNLLKNKGRNLLKSNSDEPELERRGILSQIGSNLSSPETAPLGGAMSSIIGAGINPVGQLPRLALSAAGIPEEEAAPAAFGTLGAVLGSQVGKPNIGLGLGVAGGDILKQSARKLRGTGEDIKVGDAIAIGGIAALGGKALDTTLKSIGVSFKLIPERARAKLFDQSLRAVNIGKKVLSRNWNRAVNAVNKAKPNTRVDLSDQVFILKNQFNKIDDTLIPQLKTAVQRSKKLSRVVDNPELARELTLAEAQELKNAITSATNTITKKAIRGKTTPNERGVFDLLKGVDRQIDKSFPEMTAIRRAYGEGIENFNLARPLVEKGKPVEASIFSKPEGLFGLGGTKFMQSTHGKLAFQDITGLTKQGKKVFETAKLAHDVNRAADFVGRLTQIAFAKEILESATGNQ